MCYFCVQIDKTIILTILEYSIQHAIFTSPFKIKKKNKSDSYLIVTDVTL